MNMPLWSAQELIAALKPIATKNSIPAAQGISIDSRTLVKGDLFIALAGDPGPRFRPSTRTDNDGHDYIFDAAAKGAVAALVSRIVDVDLPQIQVTDTLAGLWTLAATSRSRTAAKIVALTGSSGKTTLKEFLLQALSGGYASAASLNNFWGLPLSMARMPADTNIGIFEIGMNHPGEIAPLARLARPDVAIVLNVLPVHLEGLGSLKAIQQEKLAIAEGLPQQGTLVIPDTLDSTGAWRGEIVRFGESAAATVRLVTTGDSHHCQIAVQDELLSVELAVAGKHRQLTATAVLACAMVLKQDNAAIVRNLKQAAVAPGRGNEINVGNITVIDESYNANPTSMQLALQTLLARQVIGNKYAVLGDMLELGEQEGQFHADLAHDCEGLSGVWLAGALVGELSSKMPASMLLGHTTSATGLSLQQIANHLKPGDTILVKGSNKIFWQHDFVPKLIYYLESLYGKA